MTVASKLILSMLLLTSIVLPFGLFKAGAKTKGRYLAALGVNIAAFFGIMAYCLLFVFVGNALAAETGEAASASAAGMGYIAAAVATGMSCIGGGIAVSAAASAALGALSEDSTIMGKSLIFVGLAEGVCLYGFLISFMILGKL